MKPAPPPAVHPLRALTEFGPAPSLEVVARDRLLSLCLGLAVIHALIAFGHILNPEGWNLESPLSLLEPTPWSRIPAWVVASATAFFLFVLRLLLPRLPLRWAHPLGEFVATLVVINALGWFTTGVTPEKTVPLMLVVFGAGCVLFTTRSLLLVIAIAWGGWLWFALTDDFASGWPYFAGALFASSCLAVLFHRLHLRSLKEMLRTEAAASADRVQAQQVDEERFRQWYEATFEGIAIHDRGVILEGNRALATLLRCDPEALVGQNLLDWFTRASRSVIEESILLGNFRPFQAVALRPDKSELHVELFTKRVPYHGREAMVTAFRDITERQRASEALAAEQGRLQQQYQRQLALAKLTVNLGEATEVSRVLDSIVEAGVRVLPASGGACLFIFDREQFALAASHLAPAAQNGFDPLQQFSRVAAWIAENRETFVASDITRDDPFEVNQPVSVVSAYVGVPLLDGERLLGIFLVCDAGEPRHFKPDEMDFIHELANRAALAMAKARLYEQLSEANRHLESQSALLLVRNEELAKAKCEAEAALRAKSEFLAKISHELRTPMNGVVGMTDYLLTTKLDADQRESADALRDSAERLQESIERLLDFSRLTAGEFVADSMEFDPHSLADSLFRRGEKRRGDKPVELHISCAPSLPRKVRGDAATLESAVWNVLENALQFTERGQVEVTFTLGSRDGEQRLICSVSDTAGGLPDVMRNSLFAAFTQGDNSLARSHEGLGLGLALTHRLVTEAGGQLAVESTPGIGSVFTILFPVEVLEVPAVHRNFALNPRP